MKPTEFLQHWLKQNPAPWTIGQVFIQPGFALRHIVDPDATELKTLANLAELRTWIKSDAAGNFRPLRANPTLRPGWKMEGLSFSALLEALQTIYPAAVANWALYQRGQLLVTPYQETAERQTGRFHITRTLGAARLQEIIAENCAVACAKIRLWPPHSEFLTHNSTLPLLCPEACNFLMEKARAKIKGPSRED